jgi:TonB family protein
MMMQVLAQYISQLGQAGIHLLWVPLIIWTVFALIAAAFLKTAEDKISPSYQYYGRVALIWGLAAGIIGSLLFYYFPFHSSIKQGLSDVFIAIPKPAAVNISAAPRSINWASFPLWIGIVTVGVLLCSVIGIVELLGSFFSLNLLSQRLPLEYAGISRVISKHNKQLLHRQTKPVRVVFSEISSVPFTFGWIRKCIVLPHYLQTDKKKLNIALHHELIHIQNRDYLIHTTIQIIQALFFFHPLVRKFTDDIEEYREICCDRQVLQNANISQKHYAQLLLDFSPKPVLNSSATVNMAVHPSNLKKRIQKMKKSTHKIPSLRKKVAFMSLFVLMITGIMCFSGISKNEIARAKILQSSVKSANRSVTNLDSLPSLPIYRVNGKKTTRKIVSRLKPKYIQSVVVLKGKKAVKKYGKSAKNGVVSVQLKEGISRKKALNDLLKRKSSFQAAKDTTYKKIYVSAEQMPKLKGGLRNLQLHIKYPPKCKKAEAEGRVTVRFVVNKKGIPVNTHVIRGIGHGCDKAAVRAVKKYARFIPGRQHGKAVNIMYAIPIVFSLSNKYNKIPSSKNGQKVLRVRGYPGISNSSSKDIIQPMHVHENTVLLYDSLNAGRN